ncbi:MAG: hypothetical protein HYZ14_00025 [Bacteroidetes bacterium]|nr:hypothetical protein [Bacteroidota bacterium]
MIKLNRNSIYLLALLLFALILTGPQLIRYLFQDTCICHVESFEHYAVVRRNSGKYSVGTHTDYYSLPVARCKTETLDFTVEGRFRGNYGLGDPVTVLYSANNPYKGVFLSFHAFWFPYYIPKLVALMVLTIAVYSFVSPGQFLIIRYKRQPGEKVIELTRTEKDTAMLNKLKRARAAMFSKRLRSK